MTEVITKRRYFAGFMGSQAKWLNSMSAKGYRLIKTGILEYKFEECEPDKYVYTVEYVGDVSKADSVDYKQFLEGMGYRVFYKNINLDFSIFKATYRPWAKKGGRISTTAGTYNRELMIVEKENDGTPFELHTDKEDLAEYYRRLNFPWYFAVFICLAVLIVSWPFLVSVIGFGVGAVACTIPIIINGIKINKLKKEKDLEE